MTDNELLLAISNMLEPIREDIREIKVEILGLKNRISSLESEVSNLKSRISGIESEISGLKGEITGLKGEITGLKGEITGLRADFIQLSDKVTRLENYTKNTNYRLELEVIPRLQNIEQCYLSTYERYKLGVEEHDIMKQDISVLKNVVTKHSEKLQMIS